MLDPCPQILSIKGEFTFRFSSFNTNGLYNCSANFLLQITSFLTVPPEVFLLTYL